MEQEKKIYTIVAVTAVVTLLLSCLVGALAGGLAGFAVERRQAERVAEHAPWGERGKCPMWRKEFSPHWDEDQPLPMPMPEEKIPPFEMMPHEMQGALIVEVLPGTPAEQAGLEVGDVIGQVDQIPIDEDHPLADVIGTYRPGDRVTVHIWRADHEETLRVRLDANPDDPGRAYLGVRFETMSGMPDLDSGD